MLKFLCFLFFSTAFWKRASVTGPLRSLRYIDHQTKTRPEGQSFERAVRIQDEESPRIRYCDDHVEVAAVGIPARLLCGDFFHLSLRRDGVSLFLGDVSGKGLPAALYRSRCLAVLENALAALQSLQDTMIETDRSLTRRQLEDHYLTLVGIHLDPERLCLSYACAGHPLPVLLRNGQARYLPSESNDPPLGVWENWSCTVCKISLRRGDVIVMYSDGFSEARNSRNEFLGEQRLLGWCEALAGQTPDQIVEKLLTKALNYSNMALSDDTSVAVLCIR